jgi:hypothetical protein
LKFLCSLALLFFIVVHRNRDASEKRFEALLYLGYQNRFSDHALSRYCDASEKRFETLLRFGRQHRFSKSAPANSLYVAWVQIHGKYGIPKSY